MSRDSRSGREKKSYAIYCIIMEKGDGGTNTGSAGGRGVAMGRRKQLELAADGHRQIFHPLLAPHSPWNRAGKMPQTTGYFTHRLGGLQG